MAKEKIKVKTLEQVEDELIGPKGSPKRDEYEKAVIEYRKKVVKRVYPCPSQVVSVLNSQVLE